MGNDEIKGLRNEMGVEYKKRKWQKTISNIWVRNLFFNCFENRPILTRSIITMENEKSLEYKLPAETVGIPIENISNDYEEMPAMEDTVNTYQETKSKLKPELPLFF